MIEYIPACPGSDYVATNGDYLDTLHKRPVVEVSIPTLSRVCRQLFLRLFFFHICAAFRCTIICTQ